MPKGALFLSAIWMKREGRLQNLDIRQAGDENSKDQNMQLLTKKQNEKRHDTE